MLVQACLRQVVLGCALGLGAACAAAQTLLPPEEPLRFERLGSRDGLSHNTVLAVLQDSAGFLWIGTDDGLNRYDGYTFTVFRHDPRDDASLSDNTVQALAPAKGGGLWVGTAAGLAHYDPTTGHFRRHPLGAGAPPSIATLLPEASGRLWVGTYHEGTFLYDPHERRVLRHWARHPGDGRAPAGGDTVLPLLQDAGGRVWLSRYAGGAQVLGWYDAEAGQLRTTGGAPPTGFEQLLAGRAALWAWPPPKAPFPEGLRLRALPHLPSPPRALLEARSGGLWLGTDDGLYHYDPLSQTLVHHRLDTTGTAGLGNYVWTLHEDAAGTLWVGTRSGLFHHHPGGRPFRHVDPAPARPGGSTIMAVRGDEAGHVWLGTLGAGLLRLTPATRQLRAYTPPGGGAYVWALSPAPQGRLWVGTDAGLFAFDPPSGRFTAQRLLGEDAAPVFAIVPATAGRLWLAAGRSVLLFDPRRQAVVRALPLARPRVTTVQALHVGPGGTLWIGTEGGGLLRTEGTGPPTPFPAGGLPCKTVWTIHEDAAGQLWLGTDRGLVRLDPATGALRQYADPAQFPGAHVYSILPEGAALWLGTSQGLVRFHPASGVLRRYDEADGTGNTEYNRRAAWRSRSGALFFGGLHGLTVLDPGALRDDAYVPPLVFTRIEKLGPAGAVVINPAIALRDGLVLAHDDHVVTFEFAALSLRQAARNRYAYRLEGFDEAWVEAGTQRQARYTQVPPGRYVFRVRGAGPAGRWNEAGLALRVTIRPPFWQTWWFRLLVLGGLAGLLAALYRYRVARLLELERVRLRIAADLHDDLGSKLSSIALMSDLVRERAPLPAVEQAELARISLVARQTVDALRDIVWFVNPDHERPGELALKMKASAASLLGGLTYHLEGLDTTALEGTPMAFRRGVFLIYKEALHNVARHAQATTATVRLAVAGGVLHLTIGDDGVGFDPATVAAGQGLHGMPARAAQLGGRLTVESAPGRGTTVHLAVRIT